MKKHILLFALFCCISSLAEIKATTQITDLLVINKDTLQLLGWPIGQDSLLRVKVRQRLSKRIHATNCQRGYRATWRIENNKLYLESIQEYPEKKNDKPVSLKGIFDAYQDEQGKILASWFNATIYAGSGEKLEMYDSGYYLNHEHETMYDIRKGIVVNKLQYQNFIKSSSPTKRLSCWNMVRSNFNGDLFPELADKQLIADVSILPNFNGQVRSLEVIEWKINGKPVPPFAANHPYVKELKRCLDLIPNWGVIFIRGEVRKIRSEVTLWNKNDAKAFFRKKSVRPL